MRGRLLSRPVTPLGAYVSFWVAAILICALYITPTGEFVMRPGTPVSTKQVITTPLADPNTGIFLISPVGLYERAFAPPGISRLDANPIILALGYADPEAEIHPLEELSDSRSTIAYAHRGSSYSTPIRAALRAAQIDQQPELHIGPIHGSSADLILALDVYSRVSNQDLTHGRIVSGSGSLGRNGMVLPVEGIALKAIGAQRAGAEVFFVPEANAHEINQARYPQMRLVTVRTLQDAIVYLQS